MPSRTLEDRADSAVIRAWAKDQGLEIGVKGRIPAGVRAAYETATGESAGDDEDGPDWAAAGAVTAAVPGPEPEEAAAASPQQPPGPPPPADLDEARQRRGGARRVIPGWARDGQAKPKAAPPKVTAALRSDIRAQLQMMIEIVALPWQAADPYCGGQFAATAEQQADAWLPVVTRSPALVKLFAEGVAFLAWLNLATVYRELALMVWHHHYRQDVILVPAPGGGTMAVDAVRLPDGSVVPAQQAPPQPPPDRSMYTTEVAGHVPPVPAGN